MTTSSCACRESDSSLPTTQVRGKTIMAGLLLEELKIRGLVKRGVVPYVTGQRHLRGAGELKEDSGRPERLASARRHFFAGLAIMGLLVVAESPA